MSSPYLLNYFQDFGCLTFCQKTEELGFNDKLTNIFATSLRRDKLSIDGVVSTISVNNISIAKRTQNIGEIWFKNGDLDLENYKMYLKPSCKIALKHIFPFKHILDKYAPLMIVIMSCFTCEGRFSRLY